MKNAQISYAYFQRLLDFHKTLELDILGPRKKDEVKLGFYPQRIEIFQGIHNTIPDKFKKATEEIVLDLYRQYRGIQPLIHIAGDSINLALHTTYQKSSRVVAIDFAEFVDNEVSLIYEKTRKILRESIPKTANTVSKISAKINNPSFKAQLILEELILRNSLETWKYKLDQRENAENRDNLLKMYTFNEESN